jgi:antitoxin FitA
MAAVTIRKLPEATHRAIRLRAAHNGRSTEAEIRAILEASVQPKIRIGSAICALAKGLGAGLKIERDRKPVAPASFE